MPQPPSYSFFGAQSGGPDTTPSNAGSIMSVAANQPPRTNNIRISNDDSPTVGILVSPRPPLPVVPQLNECRPRGRSVMGRAADLAAAVDRPTARQGGADGDPAIGQACLGFGARCKTGTL